MGNTLIVLAALSVLVMVSTSILALYAVHLMRKYRREAYKEGYYRGLVEGSVISGRDDSKDDKKGVVDYGISTSPNV